MAVVRSNTRFTPEELKYVSTLDIPIFDTSSIEQGIKQGIDYTEDDIKTARENFEKTMEYQDELLSIKLDTEEQRKVLDSLKEQFGLTKNTFATLDRNALKSPFQSRGIGTNLKRLMNDPKFVEITKQKMEGDIFREAIPKIKDPKLRDRAKLNYDRYRRGEIDSTKLNIGDYDYIDMNKELVEAIKLVPELQSSEFIKSPSGRLEGTLESKKRSRIAVNKMLSEMLKQPGVKENMISRGWMTEDGQSTPEYDKMVEGLIDNYTRAQTEIKNVKEVDPLKTNGAVGRFSNSSEVERTANLIDKDIENAGYELPDASVVLSAAQRRGFVRRAADGSLELVTVDADGTIADKAAIKLKKSTGKTSATRTKASLSGSAFQDVTDIVVGLESGGNYEATAPSTQTLALGKYQFIYSDFKDLIDEAIKNQGIEIEEITPSPKVNNKSKSMSLKDRQVATAFLESPEAQEEVWEKWYQKLYDMADQVRERSGNDVDLERSVGELSDTELIYLLHHEGTVSAVEHFLKTGRSLHDNKNPNSTNEVTRSMAQIRSRLDESGYTGMIHDSGNMMTPGLPQIPTDAAQSNEPQTVMDLPTQ